VSISFRWNSDVRGDVVQIYPHFSRKKLREIRVTLLFFNLASSLLICNETVQFPGFVVVSFFFMCRTIQHSISM